MPSDSDDEDLAADAAELARLLRELRSDLERYERRRRGPAGLPRPPSPRELLTFADEVAIPTLIAILEVNVKLLEALRRTIRLAEGGERVRERGEAASTRGRDVARDVSERTLDGLASALSDLQRALDEDAVPEEAAAADLVERVQELRSEVEDSVDRAREDVAANRDRERATDDEPTSIDVTGPEDDPSDAADDQEDQPDREDEVDVDVDAEIESLKDEYGEGEDDEED